MVQQTGRLLILDPSYYDSIGHYAEYDDALSASAVSAGYSVVIAGNTKAASVSDTTKTVVKCFSQDVWCRLPGAEFMSAESLDWSSNLIKSETRGFLGTAGQRPGDVIFAPNVTPPHLRAFAEMLDEEVITQPLVLMIRYQVAMYDHPRLEGSWEIIRKWIRRGALRIVTDSELLARDLRAFGVSEVSVVSVPSGGQFSGRRRRNSSGGAFTVTSLGSPRQEKGFLEILEAAQILEYEDPTIRFVLQANDPSDDVVRQLLRFRQTPTSNVEFIDQLMTSEEYTAFIESASAVLLPYSNEIYAARTSSAVVESAAAARPVIVSRNSWLAEFCDNFRIGVTCEFGDAKDLARAITECRRTVHNLDRLAEAAALDVQRTHNADELFRQLLEVHAQLESARRRTVLIVFPWAAEDVRSSGSGARLRGLIQEVERAGMRAEVLCFGYVEDRLGDFSSVRPFRTLFWTICDESAVVPGIDRMSGDRRLHLRMHLMSAVNQPLIEEIREAAVGCAAVIVEHTHLAVATRQAVAGLGLKVAVVANDFIHEPGLPEADDPAVLAQVDALKSGDAAFAVAAKDAGRFGDLGVKCALSKNPPQPKMNPRPGPEVADEVLTQWLPGVHRGTYVLFVGSAYEPNRAAARILQRTAAELAGRLKEKAPTIVIAGSAAEVMRDGNFVSLGVVPRIVLEVLYDHCLVVTIPLFSGTGTSVKTIEAIDRGCPVLTTASGARGLEDLKGYFQVVRCDESSAASAFADAYVGKASTFASQRRDPLADSTRAYARAGFRDLLKAIVPLTGAAPAVPAFDQELVDELLQYARESRSDAAFLQAVDIAGDGGVSRDTVLRAVAAVSVLRRIEVGPGLLRVAADASTLREVRDRLYADRSAAPVHVDPAVVSRLDALGLRTTPQEL